MVELLLALMVASIVLAAVSTLAGATVAADEATEQVGREQTHLRQVSMRLEDLIHRANSVTVIAEDGFELWHDNNADGLATADELTQITRGADGNALTIGSTEVHSKCQNISFAYDNVSPATRLITVTFSINENGQLQTHNINAGLRVSNKHQKF